MIDFSLYRFTPVIEMPADYEVYDFTSGYDPNRLRRSEYGVGRYNEKRVGMYATALFAGRRDHHIGIDLAAPVGTPVRSFYDGQIFLFANRAEPGDYGGTVIVRYVFGTEELYALYGHLSLRSLSGKVQGQVVRQGEVLGWIGDRHENGGWNPHLHFQLSYLQPREADMPGVVAEADLEEALRLYPDPRLVLGPLY